MLERQTKIMTDSEEREETEELVLKERIVLILKNSEAEPEHLVITEA